MPCRRISDGASLKTLEDLRALRMVRVDVRVQDGRRRLGKCCGTRSTSSGEISGLVQLMQKVEAARLIYVDAHDAALHIVINSREQRPDERGL